MNETCISIYVSEKEKTLYTMIVRWVCNERERKNKMFVINFPTFARKCNCCEFPTKHKSSLYRHLRKHTDEKRFGCNYCPQYFVNTPRLQNNQKFHMDEFLFQCSGCLHGFERKRDKIKHGITCKSRRCMDVSCAKSLLVRWNQIWFVTCMCTAVINHSNATNAWSNVLGTVISKNTWKFMLIHVCSAIRNAARDSHNKTKDKLMKRNPIDVHTNVTIVPNTLHCSNRIWWLAFN